MFSTKPSVTTATHSAHTMSIGDDDKQDKKTHT